MTCPRCASSQTTGHRRQTALGYRTFARQACRSVFNERTGTPVNELQYPTDVVLLAVLWRLRYKLSLRDVAELRLHRSFEVTHETVREWEFRFAPPLTEQLRSKRRGRAGVSWYLDETYVKVAGRWCYRYRAIGRDGELLDSMLSERRDKHAARRFLRRLVEVAERKPRRVTTDLHPAYRRALRWIIGRKAVQRTAPYLNNYTEQSHRAVKQRHYPMLGFGSFESASRCCSAFDELRQYFRVRRRGDAHVSPAEQRRLFLMRWRSLISEAAAASGVRMASILGPRHQWSEI